MANSDVEKSSLVYSAQIYATAAHTAAGQLRKYTDEPYIVHPKDVVDIIMRHVKFPTKEMLAAAWLHDVIEDTFVRHGDLVDIFGKDVAMLVDQVSKPKELFFDKDRKERNLLTLDKLKVSCPEAATIKLADIISNCKNLKTHAPFFAVTYFKEKRAQLDVLQHGNKTLFYLARDIILGED